MPRDIFPDIKQTGALYFRVLDVADGTSRDLNEVPEDLNRADTGDRISGGRSLRPALLTVAPCIPEPWACNFWDLDANTSANVLLTVGRRTLTLSVSMVLN